MKRAFKILAWTGLAIVLVIFVLAFVFFLKLPSPSELGKSLVGSAGKSQPTSTQSSVQSDTQSDAGSTAAETATADSASALTREEPVSASDANLSVKNGRDLEALNNLMDPEQPKSQVCGQLGGVELVPDSFKYNTKAFGENFKSALLQDRSEKDPMIMAMLAPIRHFLQQPKMHELLKTVIEAAHNGQESSLKEKAGFYASLLGVYQEMKDSQKSAEVLMDRSYHLMMLARAVKKNPSLVSDSQLNEYCHKIEQAANAGALMNWPAEKAEFQSLLESLHVSPQEIGYDPKYQSHLQVEQSEKGVHFRGGWIDDMVPQDINIGKSKPGESAAEK